MSRRGVLQLLVVAALAGVLGGCGDKPSPTRHDPFAYDRTRPLRPVVRDVQQSAGVRVQSITYTAADGAVVPALLALPRGTAPKGCLIYQGGAGSTKEQASQLWPAAAALGLATFTIDTRYTGARATSGDQLLRVLQDADRVAGMVRDDVIDLRRGIDYLEGRPECRQNFGYLGTSQGALLGALLAGDDARIHAAVLTSIGATWRSALLYDTDVLLPGVTERPQAMETAVRKLQAFDAANWVGKISPRPVMLVDGLRDPRVPVVEALNLAAAARQPKTLMLHRGGHDPFTSPDGALVSDRIGVFLLNELVENGSS
jgi:cephalosporin-C deacetylase-like acetyl esterase